MNLINENPYRVAGLLSNSSERELQKQKTKIKAFAKVGKDIISDYDFSVLEELERSEELVNKAFSLIEQNQDKVDHSIFWFIDVSPFDKTAFEYLKKGDSTKATEIWDKITNDKEVTSKNFSAFNNLGTLKLLSKRKTDIKSAISLKVKLIESDYFHAFIQTIADQTFAIDSNKQKEKFTKDLLVSLSKKFTEAEIIRLFNKSGESVFKVVSNHFTERPLSTIERQIEVSKKKRKDNASAGYQLGLELIKNTANEIMSLELILGKKDLKFAVIADQLATEILQCGIDYFNYSQDKNSNDNYLRNAKKLTETANSIAVGKIIKDRIKDNLETLNDMNDREVNTAIAILKSVKEAYHKAISEIDLEVERQRLFNRIDYNAVNRLKTNCLNWDKVVEIIHEEISVEHVEAIKKCGNSKKVNEYKKLTEALFEIILPLHISRVTYLCYWREVSEIKAKVAARARSYSNDGGSCYIATMAYGDYEHPQVIELRKFRDNFLHKSVLGREFIRLYYKYSPSLVKKFENNQRVNSFVRKALDQFINIIKF